MAETIVRCDKVIANAANKDESVSLTSASKTIEDDFSDLDRMGFLLVTGKTRQGMPVITVLAKCFENKAHVALERLHRYILAKCNKVVQVPYSLVWIHTKSRYWQNCPSLLWLWRTWEAMPENYHQNLSRVFVLHCDLTFWLCSALVVPLWRFGLWKKIEWLSRAEFLWFDVDKRTLQLPPFVVEHDYELEEQPLKDYGVVVYKEALQDAAPGHGAL